MPKYFRENGFNSPTDPLKCAFQYAHQTYDVAWEHWSKLSGVMENFNTFMSGIRGSRPTWIEWFPLPEQILDGYSSGKNGVLLVDIGGGSGHDVDAFRKKFPDQEGRLVLQDLPAVIGDIQGLNVGIERMKYDFFTPQPIRGNKLTILLITYLHTTTNSSQAHAYTFSTLSCMTGPTTPLCVFLKIQLLQ
jgi:hypothetical protein